MDQALALSLSPVLAQWQIADGHGAKYQRLAAAFAACIQSGMFAPGSRLPSELEICARLPLGLSTVQKAMAQLVEDGLVVRRRKLGSFIADREKQVPEVHVYRFRDPVTGEVILPYTRVLRTSRVAAAEYGPLLIEFGAEEVMRIDRLVWVPASQPSFSTFFMRCEHHVDAPDTETDALNGASYHRLLWEHFGVRIDKVRHVASVDLLSRQACERLDLAAPHVGMVWDAFEYDRQGRLQIVQRFELPRGHRPMELTERK